MQWWGVIFGVGVGIALATLMSWRGRAARWRRQAEGIHDAARFGWLRVHPPRDGGSSGENGNENRS